MNPNDLYIKGVLLCVGEITSGGDGVIDGINYIKKAKYDGNKRAEFILSKKKLSYYYICLDATKMGSKHGYDELLKSKNQGDLYRDIPTPELVDFDSAIYNFKPSQTNFSKSKSGNSSNSGKSSSSTSSNSASSGSKYSNSAINHYETALRYMVGDITGRQNLTKAREYLNYAKNEGSNRASFLLSSNYMIYYGYMDAAEMGIIRAINKVTKWHLNGELNGKIPDAEIIAFAKKIVAFGDIY